MTLRSGKSSFSDRPEADGRGADEERCAFGRHRGLVRRIQEGGDGGVEARRAAGRGLREIRQRRVGRCAGGRRKQGDGRNGALHGVFPSFCFARKSWRGLRRCVNAQVRGTGRQPALRLRLRRTSPLIAAVRPEIDDVSLDALGMRLRQSAPTARCARRARPRVHWREPG